MVDTQRPQGVFRVEPATDVEDGAAYVLHELPDRAPLRQIVVGRVVYNLLPEARTTVEQTLVGRRQRPHVEIEVVSVGCAEVEGDIVTRRLRPVRPRGERGGEGEGGGGE